MPRVLVLAWMVVFAASSLRGAEVSGRVVMPDVCALTGSVAVVSLEPKGGTRHAAKTAEPAVIHQRGLQFRPRVVGVSVGRQVRFTNEDGEGHSVHSVTPGYPLNQSVAPGGLAELTPIRPGVVQIVCDVHTHMRAFVVVSASPWIAACREDGRFHFRDVPEGRYVVRVWHEMGTPLTRPIEVKGGRAIDLDALTLTAPERPAAAVAAMPARPWPEVIDRICLLLQSGLQSARRGEGAKAVGLVDDAYLAEFEASDMETAVRSYLGFGRAREIENRFRELRRAVRSKAGDATFAKATELSRALLLDLGRAADELAVKRVLSRADVFRPAQGGAVSATSTGSDRAEQLAALGLAFAGVADLADKGRADDAAEALMTAYWERFEPLESPLKASDPARVQELEGRFAAVRGAIRSGRKGGPLRADLAALHDRIAAAAGQLDGNASFGLAFAVSLGTILREGVEVILILGMLVAAVARAGGGARVLAGLRWGIGLAAAASAATALGLYWLVSSARGLTREVMEGALTLAAAGVLFYVSYWLISQAESKRWTDFLKRRTLGLMAFLAVYREGAETALMYQGLISWQSTRAGVLGVAAGLAVGLVLLAGIYAAIRVYSVRLPLRPFFRVTGFLLFAMAVVFAGHGVAELQAAGILRVTPVDRPWLGHGVPALGLYPNVQCLSIQGLLLGGAVLSLLVMMMGDGPEVARAAVARPAPVVEPVAEEVEV
jgi:high-affinity iron transporter